ncbi:MAG: hypothetical protein LBP86_07490, partial [Azoarcus sp.]|nr:hypothetical protein [Azoarcus sp.]
MTFLHTLGADYQPGNRTGQSHDRPGSRPRADAARKNQVSFSIFSILPIEKCSILSSVCFFAGGSSHDSSFQLPLGGAPHFIP